MAQSQLPARRLDRLRLLRKTLAAHETRGTDALEYLCPGDTDLGCPLKRDALHEVYARDASHAPAATGFAASLALRLGGPKTLFWIATDYAALEHGALNGSGLLEFGVDPARVVVVKLAKGEDALQACGDILSCGAVGAVILELNGKLKPLDLTASRRLSLAAARHKVSALLLRFGALPEASAAETRWLVHAAASPQQNNDSDWGHPTFVVQLLRNRHGGLGEWRIEWDKEHGFFRRGHHRAKTPYPVSMAGASADRSLATQTPYRRAI